VLREWDRDQGLEVEVHNGHRRQAAQRVQPGEPAARGDTGGHFRHVFRFAANPMAAGAAMTETGAMATIGPMTSALLVVVAAAEAAVGEHRALWDGAAAMGVPAHITVLYPFVAPELIDAAVLAAVREAVSSVPRFDAELVRVAWFDERVVYVEPAPAQRFRELTAALWRRFPDWPPYGGVHSDVVPHLTIGHDAARDVLAEAAADVESHLPIRFGVEGVRLMAGSSAAGSWRTLAEFPLG
jgi:2'-5' RNA ligase